MQSSLTTVNDFQALSGLKKGAREKSPETIRQVAKQFESLFVQMMLKSMRDTVPENQLFASKAEKMYQDMYDKQLSKHISNGKGIGLADSIERQLGGTPENEISEKNIHHYLSRPRPVDNAIKSHVTLFSVPALETPKKASQSSSVSEEPVTAGGLWNTAKAFIDDIWPHALRAADVLGVGADVLVAQSALETGWGKHTPKHADGSNSFNLFGIKADQRWQGDKLEITTREYRHGVVQQEQAKFRAYESTSQAFEDYTRFILDNPRYRQALEHAYDGEAYARELQHAGYATDPNYARKINRIRNDEAIQSRVSELKNLNKVPLT